MEITIPDAPFQITTTERGGLLLMENNYIYTKHRTINEKVHWQCIERVICKARIHTCGNVVVSRNNEHNHESNSANFHCSKLKAGIKRSASETQVGTHSIIANSSSLLEEASAVKLPKLNSLKQTVRRERKRVANVPPEPSSLSSLEFPNIYMRTDKGLRFLLYDSGLDSGNQRIVVFGTDSNIQILNTSSVWLADGTFKCVPNLFYQLYVIHGLKSVTNPMKDGHLIPSLFILLPNKMETTYNKMWDQVKLLCPDACPTHLIVDFEKAAINAFSRHYPLTQIKGCFFHLTQNIWRKVQEFGLQRKYQEDPIFALQIRMIAALAFAPQSDVPELFNQLMMQLPTEAYNVALYFESTYIGRRLANSSIVLPSLFPLEMWNNQQSVQQGLPRTTNAVEAWHRSFSCLVSCNHPSIWLFLEKLKKEQGLVEIKQTFYLTGREPPKRKLDLDYERALINLVEGYLTRDKLEFLKGVAYQFSLTT